MKAQKHAERPQTSSLKRLLSDDERARWDDARLDVFAAALVIEEEMTVSLNTRPTKVSSRGAEVVQVDTEPMRKSIEQFREAKRNLMQVEKDLDIAQSVNAARKLMKRPRHVPDKAVDKRSLARRFADWIFGPRSPA